MDGGPDGLSFSTFSLVASCTLVVGGGYAASQPSLIPVVR